MGNVHMRAEQIDYGASNVKAALDTLDPESIIALDKRMDKIDAWKATVEEMTFTGSELTITNALKLPARSLVLDVGLIQDLHGYDHPWAGGAGKNKLNVTLANIKSGNSSGTWNGNVYTYQGLNFEPVFDNDGNFKHVKVTGTATALTQFYVNYEAFTPSGNFILNGCPNGGSYSTFDIRTNSVNDAHADCVDIGSGVAVNRTETGLGAMSVVTTVRSGYNCGSGIIFYPMLRLSTESDATFAPYSNICPISGRSSLTVNSTNADESETKTATIQLGTTVYGARINFKTGECTVTHALVDMGTLEWTYASTYLNFIATVSGIKGVAYSEKANAHCSAFKVLSNAELDNASYGLAVAATNSRIIIRDAAYTDANTFTAAVTGQTLCYELATPTTLQLTPTELEMLKGYNKVTTTDGAATITLTALTGDAWEV